MSARRASIFYRIGTPEIEHGFIDSGFKFQFIQTIIKFTVALENTQEVRLTDSCEAMVKQIFARCGAAAPNFNVEFDWFRDSICRTVRRFVAADDENVPGDDQVIEFLDQLQADDLFLAIACANGCERAWWEFDQLHRAYLERVARHLASSEINAQEVVDSVYVELYGTRVVDGERVSKFSTYSGRGSLRGWLRTVIWHSLVDLHRASHDEVSLDEMTENVGEGAVHANFANASLGGEDSMIDEITRQRYRKATVSAIEIAFGGLDGHEKLLLLYYHVENLKLREIARLVESENSPLRDWFQRKSANREKNPESRIHESTIMRWLEKSYGKVLQLFRSELKSKHSLRDDEIAICMELATQDLAGRSLHGNLSAT
jgi:RNA polymerase sigma-70 factor